MNRSCFAIAVTSLLATSTANAASLRYTGVDAQRNACTVSIRTDDRSQALADLALDGLFTVAGFNVRAGTTAPESWANTLTLSANFNQQLQIEDRGNAGLTVTGRGTPIFYDAQATNHKLILTGSLAQLSRVSYTGRGLGGRLTLECSQLQRLAQ